MVFTGAVKITSKHDVLNRHQGAALLDHLGFFTLASLDQIREEDGDPAGDYLKVPNEYFSGRYLKEATISGVLRSGTTLRF